MEYLELGPTPAEENCQQTQNADYHLKAIPECKVYKEYLERLFPVPEELQGLVYFTVKSYAHDFGRYYEVAIAYHSSNSAEVDFAFEVESKLPTTWDEISRQALAEKGLILAAQ